MSGEALGRIFRVVARLTRRRCAFFAPSWIAGRLRKSGFAPADRRLDPATFVATGCRFPDGWRPGSAQGLTGRVARLRD
jgi:hypothetical protein